MYSEASVLDEHPALLHDGPGLMACVLDDYPMASVLSPLILSPDTHHFPDQADPWQSVEDISFTKAECNLITNPSLPSLANQVEYSITSLDDMTSSVNNACDSGFSDVSSPESQILSYDTTEVPAKDASVTSRLKSILMSRKKIQENPSLSSSQGLITSLHNYSLPKKSHRLDNNTGSEEQNREKYFPKSALRFPPCFVCGGVASGLHYGVNSCEPCKGFFTRYLRKKEDFKCAKESNCPVTNRLRGNCSACRLKKCLALGMSRKNSRLGRYSLSRRMETIMQVNELEKKQTEGEIYDKLSNLNNSWVLENNFQTNINAVPNFQSVAPDANPNFDTTNNNPFSPCIIKAPSGFSQKLVKVLVEYMENIKPYGEDLVTDEQIMSKLLSHYDSYELKISVFGNLKTIPKDEYFNLLKGYGIEIDKRMMFLKQSADEMIEMIERYCNFAKQIPNFKALSNRDQKNLLKSSRYDFFMILMHSGYLHEKQVFLAHNGAAFHMEEVADKFFSRKLVINVCDMYHRLQKLKLSKEEKALLISISLVFTDRCSLENPRLVQQIQFSLTQLLQKQLEKTCPSSAFRRFTKIIDCLTIMRESSELFLKEYNELCQDEMIIEEVPIMTELLFED